MTYIHRRRCLNARGSLDRFTLGEGCKASKPCLGFVERCRRVRRDACTIGDEGCEYYGSLQAFVLTESVPIKVFGKIFSEDADVNKLVSQVMPLVASFQVCILSSSVHTHTLISGNRLQMALPAHVAECFVGKVPN